MLSASPTGGLCVTPLSNLCLPCYPGPSRPDPSLPFLSPCHLPAQSPHYLMPRMEKKIAVPRSLVFLPSVSLPPTCCPWWPDSSDQNLHCVFLSLRNLQCLLTAYRLKMKCLSRPSKIPQSRLPTAFLSFSLMALPQIFTPAGMIVSCWPSVIMHLQPTNLL